MAQESVRLKKPKHVGTWVIGITNDGEMMKWGRGGGTEFPYGPRSKEPEEQARYLSKGEIHADDTFYIVHVFDNGQMKQFLFEDQ